MPRGFILRFSVVDLFHPELLVFFQTSLGNRTIVASTVQNLWDVDRHIAWSYPWQDKLERWLPRQSRQPHQGKGVVVGSVHLDRDGITGRCRVWEGLNNGPNRWGSITVEKIRNSILRSIQDAPVHLAQFSSELLQKLTKPQSPSTLPINGTTRFCCITISPTCHCGGFGGKNIHRHYQQKDNDKNQQQGRGKNWRQKWRMQDHHQEEHNNKEQYPKAYNNTERRSNSTVTDLMVLVLSCVSLWPQRIVSEVVIFWHAPKELITKTGQSLVTDSSNDDWNSSSLTYIQI